MWLGPAVTGDLHDEPPGGIDPTALEAGQVHVVAVPCRGRNKVTTHSRKSVMMMSNTGRAHNLVGQPIRADGWFGNPDGIHTVQVIYSNFTGAFGLQGTLELDPQEGDWFHINLNQTSAIDSPFVRFPVRPHSPTGDTGDTGTLAFTFTGNFVWLRAVLDRGYLIEPSPTADTTGFGHIDRVLLSL